MVFPITNPPVQVGALHVDGVSPAAQAKVAEVQKRDRPCPTTSSAPKTPPAKRLEDAYKDLAFLDVAIDPGPLIRKPSPSRPTRSSSISTRPPFHEGDAQYHLAKLELAGNFHRPVQARSRESRHHSSPATSPPASTCSQPGVRSRRRQFTRHGYMDAKFSATTTKGHAADPHRRLHPHH